MRIPNPIRMLTKKKNKALCACGRPGWTGTWHVVWLGGKRLVKKSCRGCKNLVSHCAMKVLDEMHTAQKKAGRRAADLFLSRGYVVYAEEENGDE